MNRVLFLFCALASSSGLGQPIFNNLLRRGPIDPVSGSRVLRFNSPKCELVFTSGRPHPTQDPTNIAIQDDFNRPQFIFELKMRQSNSFKSAPKVWLGFDSMGNGPEWLGLWPEASGLWPEAGKLHESNSWSHEGGERVGSVLHPFKGKFRGSKHTVKSWFSQSEGVLSATSEVTVTTGRTVGETIRWTPTKFLWTYSLSLSQDRSQIRNLRYTYSEGGSQKEVFDCGSFTNVESPQPATELKPASPETVDQRIQRGLEAGEIRLRTVTAWRPVVAFPYDCISCRRVRVETTDGFLHIQLGERKYIEVNRTAPYPDRPHTLGLVWFDSGDDWGERQVLFPQNASNYPPGKPVLLMVSRDRRWGSVRWQQLQVESPR